MIKILIIILTIFGNFKKDDYVAYLDIPKIDFKMGLYAQDNYKNDIEYNIAFHDISEFPNNNSNTVVMGHSGTSEISFFDNLKKLSTGDSIYFYYDRHLYEFIIDTKYLVKKDGTLDIIRNKDKMTLTLITCYLDDYQLVIIAYKK